MAPAAFLEDGTLLCHSSLSEQALLLTPGGEQGGKGACGGGQGRGDGPGCLTCPSLQDPDSLACGYYCDKV